MQNRAMGYDRTATMFSPDGRLLQVEYAEKTIRLGSASLGISCKDGVVIIADRRTKDKLIVEESANKVYEIDEHIMASAAGILSDARVLIEKAQVVAQQNRVTYDSGIDVESVTKEISSMKQMSTQYGGLRPFGVAVMVAGVDDSIQKLYVSDVTGNYYEYKATAIGENDEKIKKELREKYKESLTVKEGVKVGLDIFKKIAGKSFDLERFDVGIITNKEKKLKIMKKEELKEFTK